MLALLATTALAAGLAECMLGQGDQKSAESRLQNSRRFYDTRCIGVCRRWEKKVCHKQAASRIKLKLEGKELLGNVS